MRQSMERDCDRHGDRDKERDMDRSREIRFEFQSIGNKILSTMPSPRKSHHRQRKWK
jgi:hypothetical protein